jgi:hypothetical protein
MPMRRWPFPRTTRPRRWRSCCTVSLHALLDFLFVLLCRTNPERDRQLAMNLERVNQLLDA